MKKLQSLKWVNDRMKDCRCDTAYLTSAKKVRLPIEKMIRDADLTVVGRSAYQFDHGGYTSVWLFKQSHLSLHSWPEYNFVTLSIEVCNFKNDNASKIDKLYARLLKFFKPKKSCPKKLTTHF